MSSQKKHRSKKHSQAVRSAPEEFSFVNLLQSALFGALFGILAAAILAFATTAVCYATADPGSLTTPLSLAALYLASLVAGFAALRHHRSMALACGSLSGLFLMLVFLVLSLLLRGHVESTFSPLLAFLLRLLMIPTAAIGGYLGLSKQSHKKRHVHK